MRRIAVSSTICVMPRNARCVAPGLPYPITQSGTDRQKVFFSVADRHRYLALVKEHMGEAGIRVLAYCLMTNHVHLVVAPDRADSLALLFSRVHGRYSQYVNIRRGRSGRLWQARYYSCPMSERQMWIALRYVEENPCRAGLVTSPELYRWSSAAAHLTGKPDVSGILDWPFGFGRAAPRHGRRCSKRQEGLPTWPLFVKCTYGGRPFGEEEFVREMEQRFDREWRRSVADSVGILAEAAENG